MNKTIHLKHLRDLEVSGEAGNRTVLHGASGLALCGSHLHVVSDDSGFLATFRMDGEAGGCLTRLSGRAELPSDPAARKRLKPDFEVLITLPAGGSLPHGGLLAMGSGSTPNRNGAAVISLGDDGAPAAVTEVDLDAALFGALRPVFREVNIEGGVLTGSRLRLFQRGNAGDPVSAVVTFEATDLLQALAENRSIGVGDIRVIDLGAIDGVPFSFTDAAPLGDAILFAAAAERTSNAYDDGELAGAMIGLLSSDLQFVDRWRLEPTLKYEGIVATESGSGVDVLLVSDADDPLKPSSLFAGSLPSTP